ncbi:MAG: mercury resistance system transport protein MerF [Rhodospirillaceae bacterium]|nr:mercury resistance system transport protein MerF [Rhodospirillaceae bacterium]
MKDATILKTGIVGAAIAAICCAPLVLVIALGAVGLSAWVGGLDYVLLPALVLFLGVASYGLWRQSRAAACCTADLKTNNERA